MIMKRRPLKPLMLEDIPKLHTKVLLRYYNEQRQSNAYYIWEHGLWEGHEEITAIEADYQHRKAIYKALKAELATREHVPNKKEAKKIRQEKAKAKKERNKR